jgi:hypothetical protein
VSVENIFPRQCRNDVDFHHHRKCVTWMSIRKDIHRIGGKLLDNTCLTSWICSRSLPARCIDRFVNNAQLLRSCDASPAEYRSCQVTFVRRRTQTARTDFLLRGDDLMAARIPLSSTPKQVRAATEALARETETSIEEVQRLYEEELEDLANDAKITQYLGVLASRRVKMRLRKH